jgi:2-dehydro-3-deoxyphosphogluconate aldolase / (4S)-4-hydroxy-2-oxoglutarate aldolase
VAVIQDTTAIDLRASPVADAIRAYQLVAVLRRVAPRAALLAAVRELTDAGVRVFEVTMDGDDAAGDLAAIRAALPPDGPDRCFAGAGTVRTQMQLTAARGAGADFAVAPVLDPVMLESALAAGLAFVPGAYTPTEADQAWRAGATFVKLFPGSSLGPTHVREIHAPLPEIETIVTGGVDATNVAAFLDAGAVAVGLGSSLVGASPEDRRRILTVTSRRES